MWEDYKHVMHASVSEYMSFYGLTPVDILLSAVLAFTFALIFGWSEFPSRKKNLIASLLVAAGIVLLSALPLFPIVQFFGIKGAILYEGTIPIILYIPVDEDGEMPIRLHNKIYWWMTRPIDKRWSPYARQSPLE